MTNEQNRLRKVAVAQYLARCAQEERRKRMRLAVVVIVFMFGLTCYVVGWWLRGL